MTTFERAHREYDDAHERALLNAITSAMIRTSKVEDANALVLRTGEMASALTSALAFVLALSPAVTHSATATRRTVDDIAKRLRRQVANAKCNPALQDFMRTSFNGNDIGGRA